MNFLYVIVEVYFTYFESFIMCINTVGYVVCLKRLITALFERSEPFHLLRLMGVSVPSLHIESTDSMIYMYAATSYICTLPSNTKCEELYVSLF